MTPWCHPLNVSTKAETLPQLLPAAPRTTLGHPLNYTEPTCSCWRRDEHNQESQANRAENQAHSSSIEIAEPCRFHDPVIVAFAGCGYGVFQQRRRLTKPAPRALDVSTKQSAGVDQRIGDSAAFCAQSKILLLGDTSPHVQEHP